MVSRGDPLPEWSSSVVEPAGTMMNRFLRTGRIVRSGATTWLVDEAWPVAVALTAAAEPQVVSWPWTPTDVRSELDRVVVADGVGIVVRSGERIIWVRTDGVVEADVGANLLLSAADADVAWLIDWTTVDPAVPPAAPQPLPTGQILALHRDGTRTEVDTPAPVHDLMIKGTDVWVTLAEAAVSHPGEHGSWSFEYPTSVLRVPRSSLLTHGLGDAQRTVDDAPHPSRARPSAWTWLVDDPTTVLLHGEPAGGLVWWAGTPTGSDKIDRQVVAVGHDPHSGRPAVRVDLGPGIVGDVQAVEDELWLTIARRRWLPASRDRGVDVVAVTAVGAIRTVLAADSVNISRFASDPERPPQQQIDAHVNGMRERFAHLDAFWHSDDGTTSPLSAGLHDPSVTIDGAWPETRLVVTFRHPARPGLLLRRTLHLFDDNGAPNDQQYADIHLMEQLDTGYIAPADEAKDGVLDI